MQQVICHGDGSEDSYFQMQKMSEGIYLRCWNVRFYQQFDPIIIFNDYTKGMSPQTYLALRRLFMQLPTDSKQRALLTSTRENHRRKLCITCEEHIALVTRDEEDGSYGAEVFIGKGTQYYDQINDLFHVMKDEHKKTR